MKEEEEEEKQRKEKEKNKQKNEMLSIFLQWGANSKLNAKPKVRKGREGK